MAAVFVWWGYRYYKTNPEAFSRENVGKSFGTMGILAILLIAFIAFCVYFLRQ